MYIFEAATNKSHVWVFVFVVRHVFVDERDIWLQVSTQILTRDPYPLSHKLWARVFLSVFIIAGNPVVACILSQGMFRVSCEFGRSKVLLRA